MDFAALLSAIDAVSILAWFAVLVVVFTVVVGLGIYQAGRGEAGHGRAHAARSPKSRQRVTASSRAPLRGAPPARKASPRPPRKEYT